MLERATECLHCHSPFGKKEETRAIANEISLVRTQHHEVLIEKYPQVNALQILRIQVRSKITSLRKKIRLRWEKVHHDIKLRILKI
jgi:hypothetical protein